jgi:hypothetical protein
MPGYRWAAEGEITAIQAIPTQIVANTTPIRSTPLDLRTAAYLGKRLIALLEVASYTSHGVTFTIEDAPDSAGSPGSYAAATTDGSLAKLSAAGIVAVAILPRADRPWLRISATGDTGSMSLYAGATLLIEPVVL